MTHKYNFLLLLSILFTFSKSIESNLTTLQHWDPSPIFSANNYLMPANSHLHNFTKARKKDVRPNRSRHFAINLSGFAQASCRARDCTGCTEFGSICGEPTKGHEMGDHRGTIYAMGLFLGNSPNGKSIWANGSSNGNIENITADSINATQLPSCLKDIAKVLSGNVDVNGLPSETGATTTDLNLALMFNPQEITDVIPSIFSEKKLEDDRQFFGAYSLPLDYRKYGFRFELNTDLCESLALTIQTGIVNIKHKTTGLINISECAQILPGCATASNSSPDNVDGTSLYSQLNFRDDGGGNVPTTPNATAQSLFDKQIAQNADKIFHKDCGIKQEICNFDEYSLEDFRILLTLKHTYDLNRYTKDEVEDEEWPAMLFTPYIWGGGSFPAGEKKDYCKILSLPFGNNGHPSIGSGIGMTFDFADTVEVGFEGGCTYFLSRKEYRPIPNNKLQRVVYPFFTEVTTEPGINWHFKGLLNAYQFMKHVNFWATYEYIEHRQDHFRLCNDKFVYPLNSTTEEKIFMPEVIECCSDWRAQFFNFGLSFDIQPGMQAGIVWQQPITPRNAYYPVSVMGTMSFMF